MKVRWAVLTDGLWQVFSAGFATNIAVAHEQLALFKRAYPDREFRLQ